MSYISDKIAEVRGMGHVVPEGIEELFLAIESEIGLDDKQKKPKQITDQSDQNPLDGERIDS
jgi:hypothetical protein